jgi:hypothetical protein
MNLPARSIAAILSVSLGIFLAQPAQADVPGPHPGYVHALNDLRYAHALLRGPAEWNVTEHERAAEGYIDRAFRDIRQAGFDDGKAIGEWMPVDANLSHRDRLARALVALERAHTDINGFESDSYARGPRAAANGDLDAAIAQVRAARRDQHWDHEAGY